MFTSHYGNLAAIVPPLAAVSISRAKPRWLKGGWLAHVPVGTVGRNYDALAPSREALKGTDAEYDAAYSAILAQLDPATVYADLGENAVCLCFCDPGAFCHRRIVAEWLEAALGVLIPELGTPRDETEVHAGPAYPFYVPPAQKLAWIETQLAAAAHAPEAALTRSRRQTATRQTWNPVTRQWEAAK